MNGFRPSSFGVLWFHKDRVNEETWIHMLIRLLSLLSTVTLKMTVGTEIASIPRSTTEQAANRAGVKGQRCNTETIDGANIPLTLRGAERSSVQQQQRHERATSDTC